MNLVVVVGIDIYILVGGGQSQSKREKVEPRVVDIYIQCGTAPTRRAHTLYIHTHSDFRTEFVCVLQSFRKRRDRQR
jgi:hypothetical protein